MVTTSGRSTGKKKKPVLVINFLENAREFAEILTSTGAKTWWHFCRSVPREASTLILKIRSWTVRSDLKNKAFSADFVFIFEIRSSSARSDLKNKCWLLWVLYCSDKNIEQKKKNMEKCPRFAKALAIYRIEKPRNPENRRKNREI